MSHGGVSLGEQGDAYSKPARAGVEGFQREQQGKPGAFWDQRDEDIHGLSNLFLGCSSAEGSFEAGLRGTGGSWEPRPQLLLIQPSPLPGLLRTLQYSLT